MAGLPTLPVAALNHLLAKESWARERLRPFAGTGVRIEGGPLVMGLRIDEHGLLVPMEVDAPVAVTLTLPADTPVRLLLDRSSLFAGVRLSGAADVAEALAFVFRNLRWDVEEDLARWVGDIPARRLVRLGSRFAGEVGESAYRLAANVAEYASNESGLLAGKDDIAVFAAAVDVLRDDLARLEKCLQRL
ncbi:MAG: hypothetical protein LBE81_10895 [Azonexus sp.]|jgi:ubiquinone biosynthesis protein UbiJ|uniref:ubiquinone biosynthesis accessory factor UbiJ n=1 Tax=Azonexus sp. TaxID=1872668 RepID=UPI002836FDC3|nr:hypothetical protein [Azonexus sp.]MDR0777125.1 hypothetical protein [Azonexus sp.]